MSTYYHTTSKGEKIALSVLPNPHLINIIKMIKEDRCSRLKPFLKLYELERARRNHARCAEDYEYMIRREWDRVRQKTRSKEKLETLHKLRDLVNQAYGEQMTVPCGAFDYISDIKERGHIDRAITHYEEWLDQEDESC